MPRTREGTGKRLRSLVRRFFDVRDLVYAHILPVFVDVKSSLQIIVTEKSAFACDARPGDPLFYLKVLFRNDAFHKHLFCPLGVASWVQGAKAQGGPIACPVGNVSSVTSRRRVRRSVPRLVPMLCPTEMVCRARRPFDSHSYSGCGVTAREELCLWIIGCL